MTKTTRHILWLGSANFVTAVGGAAVLGKAIHIIALPFMQAGSLLAFFFGAALGLLLLFTVCKEATRRSEFLVAFMGASSSIALFAMLTLFGKDAPVLTGVLGVCFFIGLCVRFAFWFLSRVLRSDRMSRESKKAVPLIEGCFHSGTILSLVFFAFAAVALSLPQILLLDVAAQLIGGMIDWMTHREAHIVSAATAQPTTSTRSPAPTIGSRTRLYAQVAVFALTTVMIQVSLFHIAHMVEPTTASIILAAFYLGMAIVGLIGGRFGFHALPTGFIGAVQVGEFRRLRMDNVGLLLLATLFAAGVLFGITNGHVWLIGVLTCFASITYETMSLGWVDLMGREAQRVNITRIVAKAYGVMALVACIAMTLMQWSEISGPQTGIVAVILFGVCIVIMLPSVERSVKMDVRRTEAVS